MWGQSEVKRHEPLDALKGSAACPSCGQEFKFTYRLDAAESPGLRTTTARPCLRCGKFMDLPIVVGGYFIEIEVPEEIALERRFQTVERRFREDVEQWVFEIQHERKGQQPLVRAAEEVDESLDDRARRYLASLGEKVPPSPAQQSRLRAAMIDFLGNAKDDDERVRRLTYEIARCEALLKEVGQVDPVDQTNFYVSVVDLRDDVRWMIETRQSITLARS